MKVLASDWVALAWLLVSEQQWRLRGARRMLEVSL